MADICNLVVAGVGGQGVLGTAHLIGRAATETGLGVRVGQIYGLSQRGGSVEATVRIGPVSTAFIGPGDADIVLGLEPLETERALEHMSERTTVLINRTPIVPGSLTQGRASYPRIESIVESIRPVAGALFVVEGTSRAREVADPRLLNMVMLGVCDGLGLLPIPSRVLAGVVEVHGPGRSPQARLEALKAGRELAEELGEIDHVVASGVGEDL